jgi:hypothetical protein
VAGLVVFAQGFLRGLEHYVDAVPFVFGVVQTELLGAERAFQGDLVCREWLGVCASKSDHGEGKLAYSLFLRYRVFAPAERRLQRKRTCAVTAFLGSVMLNDWREPLFRKRAVRARQ